MLEPATPTSNSGSPRAKIPVNPFSPEINPSGVIIPALDVHPMIGAVPNSDLAPSKTFFTSLSTDVYKNATFVWTKSTTAYFAVSFPCSKLSSFVLHATFDFNILRSSFVSFLMILLYQ